MEAMFEISLMLALATGVALIIQLMRLPLIIGYIISGILIGPAFLNLLRSPELLDVFSRLGIIALLFLVGLSLSPKVIREVGRASLLTGLGQIVFTTVIGFFIGRAFGYGVTTALYLAAAFTFSSTIIVSKILTDKHDVGKLYGKISVGFLLVQDVVATIILVILAASSGGQSINEIFSVNLPRILGLAALLWVFSKLVLPVLTPLFAQSQEFLLLFALSWGIGLAGLFAAAGFSLEIGALIAGVTLANSSYQHEISAKMRLIRDFFLIIFFITLGAGLSLESAWELALPVIVFSLFILIGNTLIVMAIMGFMGYRRKTSLQAGLTVSQISEFSFVLILFGIRSGPLSPDALTLTTFVGLITFTLSSVMLLNSEKIYRALEPFLGIFERRRPIRESDKRQVYDVILFGCHRAGADFLASLQKSSLNFLVIDFNPAVVAELERAGIPVRYGDAENNEFLDELPLKRAKMVISTLPDFEVNEFLLHKVRRANRKALTILTAENLVGALVLYDQGASYVVMPHYLGGNQAAMMLDKFGFEVKKFAAERLRHLEHLTGRTASLDLENIH